ncbi:MAG: glycosyltransferase [Acidimicrobiales bacterium]|nr:glycosyltransferase [Acidimicrobiales bacterium]MCB9392607.1 glycosyltransferase [Acidimicrobiaceae bacterium]
MSTPRTTDGMRGRRMLIVHSSDEMYGADRILLQVAAGARDLGVEVVVWLPDDLTHGATPLCHELERAGIAFDHVRLPIIRRANLRPAGVVRMLRDSWRLRARLRDADVDHVYCMTSACLLAAPAARSVRVASVGLHVQEMWSGKEAALLRALARFTTMRITISPAVDRAAQLTRPASVVVDNCVPHPDDPDARVPDGGPRPRYVVASRWNAWKGHRTLIDAWGRAGCPGLLTVLGGPPPSGAKVDVVALAAALDVPSSVEIVGEVPDVAPYVAAADALVLPSDEPEPFGLVLLEAFRQGRPVIASAAGGPLDIVDDGRDGWLFPPGDAEALAGLLQRLTVDDLADAGRHARRTYLDRYTPEVYRRRIAELLDAELTRVGR